ncbi:MAG TPA: efflux RND transporter periplasmic adaptor subunit [Chthoniobacteraceae bacterium]|jgi:RND family efflux transporter MFP subunit|nr:efflux RND transporter periplasmic adaptor subunit [Chthoniobacteraceae bacterium]
MKLFILVSLAALTLSAASRAEEVQGLVLPFKQVSVSSPVLQDNVKDIEVDEGSQVKQGDVLAHLLNDREELEVKRCELLVRRAEFEYNGLKTLADEKLATKDSELEKETDLDAAKLELQLANVALAEKTIKSPLSGIVVHRYKEPGESVDRMEKLFDIVNIDQVYIQFYLEPSLIEKLNVGDKVAVRFPAHNNGLKDYIATVAFIDPRIDAASGLFRIKLLLDNPNHEIRAGMRGEADFTKTEKTTAAAH